MSISQTERDARRDRVAEFVAVAARGSSHPSIRRISRELGIPIATVMDDLVHLRAGDAVRCEMVRSARELSAALVDAAVAIATLLDLFERGDP